MSLNLQLMQEETEEKKLMQLCLYPEVAGFLFNYTRLHKITGYLGENGCSADGRCGRGARPLLE